MTDESEPLLPADWAALAPLVDQLLDAPADQRAALLTEFAGGDSKRRTELQHLVAECERDLPLLNRPAVERFDQLTGEESEPSLPEVLGGRYRIEREIGRGGMARVYLAQDLKHARPVAVKVIRPELAASLGRDRFLREIGIAARLRHPNIMPLYDSGDVDGLLYFVMPYEAGQSLRGRLDSGDVITIADGISILRDVARALAYAHEQGVVHRDVKPDNVLLSGDAAVVTDFGIAKAFAAALTDAGGGSITQAGAVIGTPTYMAPEQAMGDPATDHRADLYAFGCVAYEVFAGKPPFTGTTTFQVIAAQMATAPQPVVDRRADVPAAIAELIARCLEKDPAARPQNARTVLDVLGAVATLTRAPTRPSRRGARLVAGCAAVAITIAAATWYFKPRGGPATVAVLPLLSVGGDSVQALLAEGFSDDIATALVKFPWIRVKSRRGAVNYLGQRDLDHKQIGKELGALYLVTGSLRNIDGKVTVLVQLMSSDDGALIWGDQFTRPAELALVRDQIVNTIGDSLRSKSGASSRAMVVVEAPTRRGNNAAYSLYLIGKRKLSQRGQSIAASIDLFREAVALDTLSADGYSGLSLALALSPYFSAVSAPSVAADAVASARRALTLNPRLAGPHVALGIVLENDYQWDLAEAEFRRALDIDPRDVEARVQYGRLLATRGRLVEALEQFQSAREEDPASAVVLSQLSYTWNLYGQLDSALIENARAQRSDSTNYTTVTLGAMTLLAVGRTEEAHQQMLRGPPNNPLGYYVFAVTGPRATSLQRLDALARMHPLPWLAESSTAFGWLGLRDTTKALDALERATVVKEMWPMMQPPSSRIYDEVRQSARFQRLLRRVGLR